MYHIVLKSYSENKLLHDPCAIPEFLSVLRMIGYMCIGVKPIYCRFDRYKRYFLKFSLTDEEKVTHSTSVAVYGN